MPRASSHRILTLVGEALARREGAFYDRLAEGLREALVDGRLPTGTRLPSERDLTDRLGVSRTTVSRAYAELREQGFLVSRRGSGSALVLPEVPGGRVDHLLTPAALDDGVLDLTCTAQAAPAGTSDAYARALADLPGYLSGTGYYPSGLPVLRTRIAQRYTERGLPTHPDQVIVAAGALGALAIALGALVRRGDGVLVESPTYPNAIAAIEGAGARPVAHPFDHLTHDWDVPALGERLRTSGVRTAYLIPDHHNPTGALMPEPQRREVAALLREARVRPIVDESLAELWLGEPPPAPFGRFAPGAISIGSLSKVMWGGLRIGWVRAPRQLVDQLAASRLRLDLGAPVLEQLVAVHLLDRLDSVLAERRAALRAGRDVLLAGLAGQLPDWRVRTPQGGMALWCALPEVGSTALAVAARAHGVALAAGPNFAPQGGLDGWVRLPYVLGVEQLSLVPERLAAAWADVRSGRVRAAAATDRRIIA